MAKAKVTALDTFHHGKLHAVRGGVYSLNKGEAEDLEKIGLVSIEGESTEDDEVDDLIGKKEGPVKNKMEPKPDNKSAKK